VLARSPSGYGQDPDGVGALESATVFPAGVLALLHAAPSSATATDKVMPRQARAVIRVRVGVMATPI